MFTSQVPTWGDVVVIATGVGLLIFIGCVLFALADW